MNDKQLRIFTTVPVTGRLDVTYLHEVILNHTDCWNWINNYYIQLKAKKDISPESYFDVDFNFAHRWDVPIIEQVYFEPEKNQNIPNLIIRYLDNGFYVMPHLDDYYIPCKSVYNNEHFVHVNFIYGYNLITNQFYSLGFDDKQTFRTINIDFVSINNGFINSDHKCMHFFRPNNEVRYFFNIEDFENQIIDFVNSEITIEPERTLFTNSNYLYGFNAQNQLIEYIRTIPNRKIHVVGMGKHLHLLWEHKKLMGIKMQYLFDNNYLHTSKFVEEYGELERITYKLRNALYKILIKQDFSRLDYIISSLHEVFNKEHTLLCSLINEL
ncbi:hypothetical protein EHE19_015250 [Ruminiclostridium herbifermentans]|uniref:Uncharacterized protein n=1 Tax=Ruminiclostridium herbifermentans TaxID=2488810 RepID=A0A4U7JLZ9_9FIRM|nr:hypothetical protein [Ruminiclostridium herbifermentans]QNU66222.1 hypothetical protein EHE19_015250 [Ruminiclostridium herbifermentans]